VADYHGVSGVEPVGINCSYVMNAEVDQFGNTVLNPTGDAFFVGHEHDPINYPN